MATPNEIIHEPLHEAANNTISRPDGMTSRGVADRGVADIPLSPSSLPPPLPLTSEADNFPPPVRLSDVESLSSSIERVYGKAFRAMQDAGVVAVVQSQTDAIDLLAQKRSRALRTPLEHERAFLVGLKGGHVENKASNAMGWQLSYDEWRAVNGVSGDRPVAAPLGGVTIPDGFHATPPSFSFAGVRLGQEAHPEDAAKVQEILQRLDQAKARVIRGGDGMPASSDTHEQVRQELGWFVGNDGLWRYEIGNDSARFHDRPAVNAYLNGISMAGDKSVRWGGEQHQDMVRLQKRLRKQERILNARIFDAEDRHTPEWSSLFDEWQEVRDRLEKINRMESGKVEVLSDVMEHDELFALYPHLRHIRVSLRIDESWPDDFVKGFFSQDRHGMGGRIVLEAGSRNMLMRGVLHEVQHAIQLYEGFASGGNAEMFGLNEDTRQQMLRMLQIDEGARASGVSPDVYAQDAGVSESVLMQIRSLVERDLWDVNVKSWKQDSLPEFLRYFRLAGEVESRNVEARMGMSDEQRRSMRPQSTEDVLPEHMIFLHDGRIEEPPLNGEPAPVNTRRTMRETSLVGLHSAYTRVARGMFDPVTGVSVLIADNIRVQDGPALMAHEMGIHLRADLARRGPDSVRLEPVFRHLFDRAHQLVMQGDDHGGTRPWEVTPFILKVRGRLMDSGVTRDQLRQGAFSGEEAAAYIAEEYESERLRRNTSSIPRAVREWFSRMKAGMRAWIYEKLTPMEQRLGERLDKNLEGVLASRLRPADIAAFARISVKEAARERLDIIKEAKERAKAAAGMGVSVMAPRASEEKGRLVASDLSQLPRETGLGHEGLNDGLADRLLGVLKGVGGDVAEGLLGKSRYQARHHVEPHIQLDGPIIQPDLFPGEFADGSTELQRELVVSSSGRTEMIRLPNVTSTGQRIAGTVQGLENFWTYYGNGPVDDKGRPIALFHATDQDFAEFQVGRETNNDMGLLGNIQVRRNGIFATPQVDFAEGYLKQDPQGARTVGHVMPVFMAIQEPLDLRDRKALSSLLDDARDRGVDLPWDFIENIALEDMWRLLDDSLGEKIVRLAREAGHDGVRMHERHVDEDGEETVAEVWMAFDPEQVKSALGNSGRYSPQDRDIRYSVAPSMAPGVTPGVTPGVVPAGNQNDMEDGGMPEVEQGQDQQVQDQQEQQGQRGIHDFGEKLGGARKDVLRHKTLEAILNVSDANLLTQPWSKIWPRPDYIKLGEEGMDWHLVAMLQALRDDLGPKPRGTSWSANYSLKNWCEKAVKHRDIANLILRGNLSWEKITENTDMPRDARGYRISIDPGLVFLARLYEVAGTESDLAKARPHLAHARNSRSAMPDLEGKYYLSTSRAVKGGPLDGFDTWEGLDHGVMSETVDGLLEKFRSYAHARHMEHYAELREQARQKEAEKEAAQARQEAAQAQGQADDELLAALGVAPAAPVAPAATNPADSAPAPVLRGKTYTPADFPIYTERGVTAREGYLIGRYVGKHMACLAGPFNELQKAVSWRNQHVGQLLERLEHYRQVPKERGEDNRPRVGPEHRAGNADVTPEQFLAAFPFRGVEFGNWVEQGKRQQDLNQAYDALLDLSEVLGMDPKSVALPKVEGQRGDLGLAFGARGIGGRDAPKAHYESEHTVMNLTKKNGAGSLAHEWFHALDQHVLRGMRGWDEVRRNGFLTDETLTKAHAHQRQTGRNPYKTREFNLLEHASLHLMVALNQTGVFQRSRDLDKRRATPYWGMTEEVAARAFEGWVHWELEQKGRSNDYLVNLVDEQTWKTAEELGYEMSGTYPYLTGEEMPAVAEAFRDVMAALSFKYVLAPSEFEDSPMGQRASAERVNELYQLTQWQWQQEHERRAREG